MPRGVYKHTAEHNRRIGEAVRASWEKKGRKPLRHGSVNGYVNHKCRCAECRNAWRVYTNERRRVVREANEYFDSLSEGE